MRMLDRMMAGVVVACAVAGSAAWAQTSAFTYQGTLNDGMLAADGTFDLRFRLFAAATGGATLETDEHLGVEVEGGVFSVVVDFGSSAFDSGSDRYMGIEVREAGGGSYTALTPRVLIGSVPFAEHADRAEQAAYAESGPFEPIDPTPESSSGAVGQTVSVAVDIDGAAFSTFAVSYPIRIEREIIFQGGGVQGGQFGDFTIELRKRYNASEQLIHEFAQSTGNVEVSIVTSQGFGNVTDFQFLGGILSGYRLEGDGRFLDEVLEVTYSQPPSPVPLSTYVSRNASGFTESLMPPYEPFLGGDEAVSPGEYTYEYDRVVFLYSTAGGLPGEAIPVAFGSPQGGYISRPVSLLINVFDDRTNVLWDDFSASSAVPKRIELHDVMGATVWEPGFGNTAPVLISSWTLDRADDGGLFEAYEFMYNANVAP